MTKSTPAPMQCPWIAAITGFALSAIDVKVFWSLFTMAYVARRFAISDVGWFESVGSTPPLSRVGPNAFRSIPTVNDLPLAAMTIARVLSSPSSAPMTFGRSIQKSSAKAFRLSGLSSQTIATRPSNSTVITSDDGICVCSIRVLASIQLKCRLIQRQSSTV